MDLISRKAATDDFMEKPFDYYHTSYIVGKLNCIPSVPAVPLDKLCERLVNFSECPSCAECKLYGIKCGEYGACGSKEHWMAVLRKWMEEQDATD